MRNKLLFTLIVASLTLYGACSDNDEKLIPGNISNIRMEPRNGAVVLKWDVPSDSNYLYVETRYYNPWTEKEATRLSSVYSDTLLIDEMLNKFGDYEFTMQTVSSTGNRGEVFKIKGSCDPRKAEYKIVDPERMLLTVSMLSTNEQEPNEGPLANVLDGSDDTFFHSRWSGVDITWPHYITINFGESIEAFRFSFTNRKNANGKAKIMDVMVSKDGTNFKSFEVISKGLPSGSGSRYNSEFFMIMDKIVAVRLVVQECHVAGNKFFSMAQLSMDKGRVDVYDPEKE